MKIEIWSDIVCPFCFIGKRKFEMALAQFPQKESIQIEWKSFQLQPDVITNPEISVHDHLATIKRISVEQAKQMGNQVTQSASQVGLDYHFDQAIVANTFKAHQLLHFAKNQGLQNELKERLLKAYFSEGKNVDDETTLLELGKEIGLVFSTQDSIFENTEYEKAVQHDIQEARQLGIQGVPFFVFDRKYAVSGAQDPAHFAQALEQSFSEWKENGLSVLSSEDSNQCDIDGNC